MMQRYCFALDLRDDPELIDEYKEHHKKVWPEVLKSILDSGINNMEIYLTGNRLFMIMETNESFSFKKKNQLELENKKVHEWEQLMWKYQQGLLNSKPGEKWRLLDRIFSLKDQI